MTNNFFSGQPSAGGLTTHFEIFPSVERRGSSDVLILPFWQNGDVAQPAAPFESLLEKVSPPLRTKDFTGELYTTWWTYSNEPNEKRILLLGLGVKGELTQEKLRAAYGKATRACRTKRVGEVSILFPEMDLITHTEAAKAIVTGLMLANYSYDSRKQDENKKRHQILKFSFIGYTPHVQADIDEAACICRSVCFARDLINGNADAITPAFLGQQAMRLAQEQSSLRATVYEKQWIEEQGMGLLAAVGQGAEHPPAFIVLEYRGAPLTQDLTVLVGKGVTFDSGGLILKPKENILIQKSDMSGAAAVLATMQAVAALELAVNVTAVIPACENAIGSKSYKPGDVYKSFTGKTVEITNTDAEGRLILADAIAWAKKALTPSRIIDMATLTGAIIVALGTEVAGLFSNSDSLAQELLHAGEAVHERAWRMPLYEEYGKLLESDIADYKNAAAVRDAGSIVAALFLAEFVGKTPWVHLDIAGVAYKGEEGAYQPKYGTGYGVRLLVEYLVQAVHTTYATSQAR